MYGPSTDKKTPNRRNYACHDLAILWKWWKARVVCFRYVPPRSIPRIGLKKKLFLGPDHASPCVPFKPIIGFTCARIGYHWRCWAAACSTFMSYVRPPRPPRDVPATLEQKIYEKKHHLAPGGPPKNYFKMTISVCAR
jgi:hypothetical protein